MDSLANTNIAVDEAEALFAELVERVSAGEEITITRAGSPVARLIPMRAAGSPEARREAIRQMRVIASRNRLEGLRVRDLMSEGRR